MRGVRRFSGSAFWLPTVRRMADSVACRLGRTLDATVLTFALRTDGSGPFQRRTGYPVTGRAGGVPSLWITTTRLRIG